MYSKPRKARLSIKYVVKNIINILLLTNIVKLFNSPDLNTTFQQYAETHSISTFKYLKNIIDYLV